MSISRLPPLKMHWSVNNANFALQKFAEERTDLVLDVSLFFHEYSVFTSKLDPNYNLVYKFNKYLFIYFIVIPFSLLDLVYLEK